MSAAAVTVVLACHDLDRWAGILAAIRSAQTQTPAPAAVVVAVDHAPALAARLCDEFGSEVNIVSNDGPHRGASATRNAGATCLRTELVAFLDDDEVAAPGWLSGLVEPLADPATESGVAGTGGRYRPAWRTAAPRWFPDEFAWVVGGHYTGMPERTSPVRNVWAGSMALRTADFRAVGGFRAGFGKVGAASRPEDTDLCIRVAAHRGGHWLYVPTAVVDHDVPPHRATAAFFVRRCWAEGRGKVAMARVLAADPRPASDAVLADERRYATRTLPAGVLQAVLTARPERAAMIAVGALAAALGAVRELVRSTPTTVASEPVVGLERAA